MARISKSQLVKLQVKYKTDDAIGKLFGISRQAVHQLRAKYDIAVMSDKYANRNRELLNQYNNGIRGAKLAKAFNLSLSQMYRIVRRKKSAADKEE